MHWYLVHTKPRQEVCAQENLERQGYECYLPVFPKEKLRQNCVSIANEPLFPRYLFIRLGQSHADQSWTPIRSTKGVSRLVSFGMSPAKVPDGLIDHLRSTEAVVQANPERLFTTGDQVRLTDGAFVGIEGVFRMADGDRRVMVLIELMGKPVVMKVDAASLQKVV
jgi:transcriptional antiterminator RfaH